MIDLRLTPAQGKLQELIERIDEPNGFGPLKAALLLSDGMSYREFRSALRPDFRRAKIELGLACAYIALTMVCLYALRDTVAPGFLVVAGSIALGFFMAHHQLFLHAAAHYDLDLSRPRNDRIANAFVGIVSGQEIAAYRAIHFKHHNLHGTTADTEHSYFNSLSLGYRVRLVSGIEVARILLGRRNPPTPVSRTTRARASTVMAASAAAFHIVVISALAAADVWLALAWAGGLVVFFPFFAATRQVLEHRRLGAADDVDYRITAHGAHTKIFADGPFARLFGGAGFTRHALHHWDSGVAYTNLADMERFLEQTQLAQELRARRTTYGAAFRALFRWSLR